MGGAMQATWRSLQVLDLLAELLDRRLDGKSDAGQLQVRGFGAERVCFSIQLLAEEIQPPSDGATLGEESPRRLRMSLQPIQLLGRIRTVDQERRFLRE